MTQDVDVVVGLSAARQELLDAQRQLSLGGEAARTRYARAAHELEVAERRAHRLSLESRWRNRSWGVAN